MILLYVLLQSSKFRMFISYCIMMCIIMLRSLLLPNSINYYILEQNYIRRVFRTQLKT